MRQSDLVRVNPRREQRRRKATSDMKPISYSLKDVLVRQGIEAGRAGTRGRHGMKKAGRGQSGAAPQVTLGMSREEDRCLTDEPSPERLTRPVLRVINGKCLSRATPMRGPRNALDRHLTLVWSDGHLTLANSP